MQCSLRMYALTALAFIACGGAVSAGSPTATAWGAAQSGLRLGIEVDAGAPAGAVIMRLENQGSHPIHVASHVDAGDRQFDWFTVELVDAAGGKRTLHFMDARNESA